MTTLHSDDTEPQNVFYDDNPFHEPSIVVDARLFDSDRDEGFVTRKRCSNCKHFTQEEVGNDIDEPRLTIDWCSLGFWETLDCSQELPSDMYDCAEFCGHFELMPKQESRPFIFSDVESPLLDGIDF